MKESDLKPGDVTTLGALRPGDVGETLDTGERFLLEENARYPLMRFVGSYCVGSDDEPVRYLGRGRIEPARIVIEGESDPTIEQTVRRVLAAAVADRIVTGARDPNRLTAGELVGAANVLNDAMGEQLRRIRELEEQVRTLREYAHECVDNFDCDNYAHRYGKLCRKCEASAALAATAPKGETCTT